MSSDKADQASERPTDAGKAGDAANGASELRYDAGGAGQAAGPRRASQAGGAYDDSVDRFLANHPDDAFTGASGVLFEQAMAQTRMAVCLCDPHAPDAPIVFVNRAFRWLTGYDEQDIIGRNGYRPAASQKAQAKYAGQFPRLPLFTIEQAFGGWTAADQQHFADGGSFDQVFARK